MKTIRISNNDDLKLFNSKLQELVGAQLPEAYLRGSDTFGVFRYGKMVAGFVIAKGRGMRSISIVGGDLETKLPDYSIMELCEANAVWVDNSIQSYRESLAVWLTVRRELLRTRCDGVLIPWVSTNAGLTKFYRVFVDDVIFRGKPKNAVGHAFELNVGFSSRESIRWRTLRHVPALFLKSFVKSRNKIDSKSHNSAAQTPEIPVQTIS